MSDCNAADVKSLRGQTLETYSPSIVPDLEEVNNWPHGSPGAVKIDTK